MLLWICLFMLVVADGVVTEHLIAQRFAWEFNPLLANWVGDNGFLLLKAAGSLLAIFILWDISKRSYRTALIASACLVLVYTIIVYWNLALYLIAWL
jgi:hypothetical protein